MADDQRSGRRTPDAGGDLSSAAHPRRCSILVDGRRCDAPLGSEVPFDLCAQHLLAAHEWVVREVGLTDLLPSPCLACGSRLGVCYPSGWLCAICDWRAGDVPDPDLPVVRVDVVYYLRFGERIKIGTSGNPRQRLASLRFDELLAFERGDRSREQRRHAQFASHRLARTEWFETHDALTKHIAALRTGVDDPWHRYALWRSEALALQG